MEWYLDHWKTHCDKAHNDRLENIFNHLANVIKATRIVVVHDLGYRYRLEVYTNLGYCLYGRWIDFADACNIDKMLNDFVNDWFIGDLCRAQINPFDDVIPYPIRQLASNNLSELELKLILNGE